MSGSEETAGSSSNTRAGPLQDASRFSPRSRTRTLAKRSGFPELHSVHACVLLGVYRWRPRQATAERSSRMT